MLYIPNLRYNLLSTGKATDNGADVEITSESAIIRKNGADVLIAERKNGVYLTALTSHTEDYCLAATSEEGWHRRFGHINYKTPSQMKKSKATTRLLTTGKGGQRDTLCEA